MKGNIIDRQLFIKNFASKFDTPFPGRLHFRTHFRDHIEWSSLQALVIVVGFEEDYGVTLTAEELQSASTIRDLYVLINNKMPA